MEERERNSGARRLATCLLSIPPSRPSGNSQDHLPIRPFNAGWLHRGGGGGIVVFGIKASKRRRSPMQHQMQHMAES